MTRPEDAIIAEIDALISDSLARGPHDDYNSDYYPKCGCGHDWHGLTCATCSCTEYREPAKLPARHVRGRRGDRVILDEHYDGRPGYTLADLERLRWHRNPILPARRTIRFSQRNGDGSVDVVEGFFDILATSLNQQHVSVCLRVYPTRQEVRDGLMLSPVQAGMIQLEGGTPDGFVPLGYLHPEDIDVDWRGLPYQVTMRINAEFSEPLLRRLGGSP